MKRPLSRRIAAALAAVLLAGVAAGTAAAEPVSLTRHHDCAFPLLGMRPLPVVVEADVPKYAAVGETIPARTVAARVRFDAGLTTGLALADIETVSGFLALRVTIDKPDGDRTVDIPLTFPQRLVPSTGTFDLTGFGTLPEIAFTAPGQTRVDARTTGLRMHLRSSGGLGDFDLSCDDRPAEPTALATVTTPDPGVPVSLPLRTTCPMPLIGNQPTAVAVSTALPRSVVVDQPIGPLPLRFDVGFSDETADAFRLVGGTRVGGFADVGLEVRQAGQTRRASVRVRFDEVVVPETGPVAVSGPGWLDPQVFPTPGPVDFHVVSVSMDLRVRGGGIGPDDPFHVPCALDPGQRTLLGAVQVFPIITEPPSPPGDVRITDVTPDTAVLTWTPSPAEDHVDHYVVRVNGVQTVVDGGDASGITLTGLEWDTEYRIEVLAVDVAGNQSAPATVHMRTKPMITSHRHTLTGITTVKATTIALSGSVEATWNHGTGAHQAAIALDRTTATTRLLGFLPAKADIAFAPARGTGALVDGVLTTRADLGVTLPRITVLGFPISTDPACGTTVALTATAPFDAATGGTVTADYTLPPLTRCGPFTEVISDVIAGDGNTFTATLTP